MEKPMSLIDCRGVPVSTNNPESLQYYETALELSASYFIDPLAVIDSALQQDPGFASGHCLRAGLLVMAGDNRVLPMLGESVTALEALGRRANDRERAHAAAARAWLNGDFATSVRRYGEILLDYPHDLLALQVAHVGDFYLGATSLLRDRVAQVLPLWDMSIPGFHYVLGMYAFGLEETALYARAEDVGRRALELQPKDVWAVHAVAHVMEMQGRLRDGIEWLTERRDHWSVDNGFAFHNWWHLSLFHLDLGDTNQVLALYDAKIKDGKAPLELIDASALLWRLQIRGVDVGSRWQALADAWAPFADHGYYAFNDVHALMAFVGAQRIELAETTLAALERSAQGSGTNAMMAREVGLPVGDALVSFGLGHYSECIEMLLPVRTHANRFGGSHAQRDFIHLTLVEAALRAGKVKLARALIAERTQLKPASPFNWQLTARACDSVGRVNDAAKARDSAESRRKAHLGFMRA
jgi:tetratricopeptide (TPR) repeat protein